MCVCVWGGQPVECGLALPRTRCLHRWPGSSATGKGPTEGASPGWAYPRTALGLEAALCTASCPPEGPGLEPPNFTGQAPTPGLLELRVGQQDNLSMEEPGNVGTGGRPAEGGEGTTREEGARQRQDQEPAGWAAAGTVLPQEDHRHLAQSLHPPCGPGPAHSRDTLTCTHAHSHTHFLISQTTWPASPEAALEPGTSPRLAWTTGATFSGLSAGPHGTW